MRTKACIHTLTGHTSTVAVVKAQAVEPQVGKILDLTTTYGRLHFQKFINFKNKKMSVPIHVS